MRTREIARGRLANVCMAGWLTVSAGIVRAQDDPRLQQQISDRLLTLADRASTALLEDPPEREASRANPGTRDYYMFFVDSYAVRALGVAYDLSGRKRYLDASEAWADRMLRHQGGMIPGGAYFMNYHRKPGESEGQWFVADSGSIAMGVLSTALRTSDERRKRYLESVRAYVTLVRENFQRASGGVTDGYWEKSDDEWWCSTALFASTALQLYGVTGEEIHRAAGLRAVQWLLDFEYGDTILYTFEEGAPTTIFYILEAYSSALPHLEPGSDLQVSVSRRFSQTVEWIVDRQNSLGTWDYSPDNWGVKLGGFPCQLLNYLGSVEDPGAGGRLVVSSHGRRVAFEQVVLDATRRALEYFSSQPPVEGLFTQQEAFTMMSLAEELCPGELYQRASQTSSCFGSTGNR